MMLNVHRGSSLLFLTLGIRPVWGKPARVHNVSRRAPRCLTLFVKGPRLLCPHRKSNWIADRMKKLIKPRGGGGREGRALFTAAGSIENLADSSEFTPDPHTPKPGEISHTHTLISTQPAFFRLTNTETSADWFSQRYGMKGGSRRAYKSSHDYWVWSALITLSSPQISPCKEPRLTEAGLFSC